MRARGIKRGRSNEERNENGNRSIVEMKGKVLNRETKIKS
jgi:hypothetical protein